MQITIEINEKTSRLLRTSCLQRVLKTAIELIEEHPRTGNEADKYELCLEELAEAAPVYENLRQSLVNAFFTSDYAAQKSAEQMAAANGARQAINRGSSTDDGSSQLLLEEGWQQQQQFIDWPRVANLSWESTVGGFVKRHKRVCYAMDRGELVALVKKLHFDPQVTRIQLYGPSYFDPLYEFQRESA